MKRSRRTKRSRRKELMPYLTLTLICLASLFFVSGYTGFVTMTQTEKCSKYTSCLECVPSVEDSCGWSKSQNKCLYGSSTGSDDGKSKENDWIWYSSHCLTPKGIELNKIITGSSKEIYKLTLDKISEVVITLTMDSKDDFDLYTMWDGKIPTSQNYDCGPYEDAGITETCKNELDKGTYYIFVNKYDATGSFNLKVSTKTGTQQSGTQTGASSTVGDVFKYVVLSGGVLKYFDFNNIRINRGVVDVDGAMIQIEKISNGQVIQTVLPATKVSTSAQTFTVDSKEYSIQVVGTDKSAITAEIIIGRTSCE